MTLPAQQAQVFAAILLCSAAFGAAWDALRLACRLCFSGRADGVLDLCFGPVWALGMIAAALCLQTEVFRLYVLLAALMTPGACVVVLLLGLVTRHAVRFEKDIARR